MVPSVISHYKIILKLGEGGMGVVYKARDTKLDRYVALKFLPEHVAAGPDEVGRFLQEAKAAAALNHPNICTIYGVEEHDGKNFIVMEFVDGQTLQAVKANLSLKQAIDIGVQVAEGLAAAHERGVVHRDIKPENIMIRKDGIVQIMDFGLARLGGASRLTKEGSTLGTAGYMSPELVQGQTTDHRSDIFSLGVLLFEILTKQLPFRAAHETAIAYEIVNVDSHPMSSINPEISPELDAIILECLEKDPGERTQSAGQVAVDLKRYRRESSKQRVSRIVAARPVQTAGGSPLRTDPGFAGKPGGITRKSLFVIAGIGLAALIGIVLLAPWNTRPSGFTRPVHFSFDVPGQSSQVLNWEYVLQVSPDGRSIAYADFSTLISVIRIRDIGDLLSYPVRGTEGGRDPVFENNNWLSFATFSIHGFRGKVPITGGVPDMSPFNSANGMSWGASGALVYAESWPSGLSYQAGWNEKKQVLSEIDASKNEGTHMLPFILPGEKAALFTIWSKDGTFDDSRIAVVDLKTKARRTLSYNGVDVRGTSPRFLHAPWGDFLLWSRGGNLYASSFNLPGLSVAGPEIEILEGVSVNASSGKAAYAVAGADNGTLAYMSGALDTAKNFLVWRERDGTKRKAISASGPYMMPSISGSGRGVVILTGPVYKIGLLDFQEDRVSILFGRGDNDVPKIAPDGVNYVFVSNFEDAKYNIYLGRLDGRGGIRKIVATEGGYPEISNLSPDGSTILYTTVTYSDSNKIWIKNINTDQEPRLLLNTNAGVASPMFSPDGKFIAYRSNEIDGQYKLYVRPFPVDDANLQVSTQDGVYPQWSADGAEVYYRDDDRIMAARIQKTPELKVLSQRLVCIAPRVSGSSAQPDFAVAPDGRVLMLESAVDQSKPVKINVIVNWFTELKTKIAGAE